MEPKEFTISFDVIGIAVRVLNWIAYMAPWLAVLCVVVVDYWAGDHRAQMYAQSQSVDIVTAREATYRWWYSLDEIGVGTLAVISALVTWGLQKHTKTVKKQLTATNGDEDASKLAKVIRFLPHDGIAVVDDTGVIEECNVKFAKMVGALATREVIGTRVDRFHKSPDHHRGLREGFITDIVERPIVAKDVNGGDLPALLSVTAISEDTFLVVLKDD